MIVLAEGQSITSYKRMRFSQSFKTPEQKRERAQATTLARHKHSPNFDNVQWDEGGLYFKDYKLGQIGNGMYLEKTKGRLSRSMLWNVE